MVVNLPDLNIWRNRLDSITRVIDKLDRGTEVYLNMEKNAQMRPQGIVMLVLLCQLIYNKTKDKVNFSNLKKETSLQLINLGFFDYPFVNIKSKGNFIIKKVDKNIYTELTHICIPSDVSIFNDKINSFISNYFSKAGHIKSISTIIAELCNNSLEHSKGYYEMGECYCAIQKYVYSGRNAVSICIGDIGLGIRHHLKLKYSQMPNSDIHCIRKVLDGLSGRQDRSGGMGIPFIKDIVNKNQGNFHIRSGRGLIEYGTDNNTRRFEFNTSFPGTQSLIILQ